MLQYALLLALARAVVVEVYKDEACTVSIGNSSVYTAWAGVCNTAFTPDSGYAIGLDFCSPLRVTMSIFRDASAGAAEVWGSAITCAPPANATVTLTENACTQVQPCAACSTQYFKLVDTQCNAPVTTLIVQHDRGEGTAGEETQGCQAPRTANAGQRFQTREVLLGVCNGRTLTRAPESVPNGGNCASSLGSCSRLDINALSILPMQTLEGLDVTSYFADDCATSQLPMTWQSVPVQDMRSLFCRVQQEWGSGALQTYVRHGLRVYAPQPYATLQSESPTPMASPSPSPTPSSSPTAPSTPTPMAPPTAAAAPAAAGAAAVTRAEFIGIGVPVLVLLAALGMGLAALYLKLRAIQMQAPAHKEPQAVEMVNALHPFTRSRQAAPV